MRRLFFILCWHAPYFTGKLQSQISYAFSLEKSTILPFARCKPLYRTFWASKNVRFDPLQFSRRVNEEMDLLYLLIIVKNAYALEKPDLQTDLYDSCFRSREDPEREDAAADAS